MKTRIVSLILVFKVLALVAFTGIESKQIYYAAGAAPSVPVSSRGSAAPGSSKGAGNVATLRIALYPAYLRGQPLDTGEQNALVLEGFVFLFLGSVWYWRARSKSVRT